MLHMRQIPVPEWAKPFTVNVSIDFGDQEYEHFSAQRIEVWEIVRKAVDQYINDDTLVSVGEEHFFPEQKKMTGDFYIASEDYYVYRGQDPRHSADHKLVLSVEVRCLERVRYF